MGSRDFVTAKILILVVVGVLVLAFASPIAHGYHFGACNVWTGGERIIRLGVQMCREGGAR